MSKKVKFEVNNDLPVDVSLTGSTSNVSIDIPKNSSITKSKTVSVDGDEISDAITLEAKGGDTDATGCKEVEIGLNIGVTSSVDQDEDGVISVTLTEN